MLDAKSASKAQMHGSNAISMDLAYECTFDDKDKALVGRTFCFSGGSQWLLTGALSRLIYQQGEPPFEARQVFECICIHDPENYFHGVKEGIIKMKYQIKGDTYVYEKHLEECREALDECILDKQSRDSLLKGLSYAEKLLYQATHPVNNPNRHTTNEILALQRLRKKQSAHTPHLLDVYLFPLTLDIDDHAMEGGFRIGLLMTKVPGKQLRYDTFWYGKDKEERDKIRVSFKTALLELWSYQIHPQDCALRNIIWDEAENKCYIVDFEDYLSIDLPDPEAYWDELPEWSFWQLDEECGPKRVWMENERAAWKLTQPTPPRGGSD